MGHDEINALLLQNGNILTAGYADNIDGKRNFMLARYLPPSPATANPPTVPAGVTATANSASQITVTWSPASDPTGVTLYKVYRSGAAAPIATPVGTSFTDINRAPLTTYTYTVSACNGAGACSAPSAPASSTTLAATDITAPAIPTGLSAVAIGPTQVNLSWNAATDNVAVIGYRVYRNGGATPVGMPAGTSFGDSSAAPATTYYYTVAACDAAGNCSGQSAAAWTATGAAPAAGLTLSRGQVNFGGLALNSTSSAQTVTLSNSGNATLTGITIGIQGDYVQSGDCATTLNAGASCSVNITFTPTAAGPRAGLVSIASSASGSPHLVVLSGTGGAFTPVIERGWNLLGNSLATTMDVATTFGSQSTPVTGVSDRVISVWKWNAANSKWQFYSPQLAAGTGPGSSADYAASRGYELLTSVQPREGYWVNASDALTLGVQAGNPVGFSSLQYQALPRPAWNLLAVAESVSPSQFNVLVSETPPSTTGAIPQNLISLWAWDANLMKWYFYSPMLEASSGLAGVKAHADAHGLLHFEDYGKKLDIGVGFWVNVPDPLP